MYIVCRDVGGWRPSGTKHQHLLTPVWDVLNSDSYAAAAGGLAHSTSLPVAAS